jgi:hypothetical protein
MKNMLLFVVLFVLLQITPVFSQVLSDYVLETRGDTLVVKTQDDMLGEVNALYQVITMDTVDVPAGRVYMLQAGGIYPLQNNPTGYANRTTRIIGSDATPLVNNKSALSALPLVCGNVGTTVNLAGLGSAGDLIVKNTALTPAANDGTQNWLFTGTSHSGQRIEYDNCLFERTRWVELGTFNDNCSYFIRNCYFANLNGEPCRRNGGVYDGFSPLDTFLVENSTHINTQGMMYKWRANPANRIIVNHNTFVNNSGLQFSDLGSQKNASYTNNLFVNSNLQPFRGNASVDDGEHDIDLLATGIVNTYPDTSLSNHGIARKFLVEGNNLYFDPSVANLQDTCNLMALNGTTNWLNSAILMNSRTKTMFDDNAGYPYLTEGVNYNVRPNFTNPANLWGAALVELKRFTVATVDTGYKGTLADWRLINTGPSNYVYFDWPIPVDLSYDNAGLLTGAEGGFPVGDLNWFPAQKVTWNAQKAAEYTAIQNAVDNGTTIITSVEQKGVVPNEYRLDQNYPNPFNPSTTITFSLPHSAHVSLKVFDILGKEIATLVNGFTTAGPHDVTFNATNLASGVYFYKLTSGDFTQMMKMLLVK